MSEAQFDFEGLTLNEVETIEQLTGVSIDQVAADGALKGRNLKAIIFVMKRRDNPNFTIDEAGNFSIKEAMALFGGKDPKDES
jgi:hypothetical protein